MILWAVGALAMPAAAGAQAQPGTAFTTGGAYGEKLSVLGIETYAKLSFVAQGTPTEAWGHFNFETGRTGFEAASWAKGRVTCHYQVGNVAIFGGPAEKTNRPQTGTWTFTVTDNGEGGNSPPDTFAFDLLTSTNLGCTGGTEHYEVDRGNIQVHDGLLTFSALELLLADVE